jgi:hypothetical protein
MNTFPISEKIQSWLDSLPSSVPLRAVTLGSSSSEGVRLRAMISNTGLPTDPLVTAMLWIRVGIIEPAHEIVQNGSTPMAIYLHGVVHRLEADYWNSKYWFRQVKDDRLLQSLSNAIVEKVAADGLSDIATNLKVIFGTTYSPVEFVSAHERLTRLADQVPSHAAAMERIAWIEWESLWQLV